MLPHLMPFKTDERLLHVLAEELVEVDARFDVELQSDLACVNSLVTHLEAFKGKMLRPTLVILSGLAARSEPAEPGENAPAGLTEAHRTVAAVVEMVHMATLVHDDVLDEARVRRGGRTVNAMRGNETAVMLGDYLISHAYHLCNSIESVGPARTLADATNIVCEGELLQLVNRGNYALDEPTYLEIIRRKTAGLCGVCCRLGASLADAPAPWVEAVAGYGEKIGIAFQIIDDVLDLTGDEQTVGKTLGLDLAKGKLTLPLIRFFQLLDEAERTRWAGELREAEQPTIRALKQRLAETDCLAYARDRAAGFVQAARAELETLPDSPPRQLMLDMAEAVIDRDK